MGTAPIEAWLSGCYVAGWNGVGGAEFMNSKNTFLAPNGDIYGLALAIGKMVETFLSNGLSPEAEEEIKNAIELYTPETERESILATHKEWKEERLLELDKLIEIAPEVLIEEGDEDVSN